MPVNNGETVLETARRAGLTPPYSCEAGNCGTCIATLTDGRVTMRVNEVLDDSEIDDGLILTCQGVPESDVTVTYDD
nr:2Fe-2S iron-sulfur cluster binding domain-containing protein [Mycolicibacterium aichiense]